jgi:hypothetical protein
VRIALFLLLCGSAFAAEPARIRLPETAPVPQPTPGPVAVTVLKSGEWFVIDSDVPVLVLTSREGCVAKTREEGAVKIRGKFADGKGVNETRSYKGPHVWTLEAVKSGTVELIVIPEGVKAESEIIRRTLRVEAGEGPQPPPDDDKPKPVGKPAWLVVLEETSARTLEHAKVLGDAKYWDAVKASSKYSGYRFYDKDSPDVKAKGYFKGDSLPVLLIVDDAGKELYRGPLPNSTAEIDRIYFEKTGVK